jgi:hypothetical protein
MGRIKDKTEEELIELATLDVDVSEHNLTHADLFIEDLGITSSDPTVKPRERVISVYIFWVYYNWAKNKGLEPMDRKWFFIDFKKRFDQYKQNSPYSYFVNKVPFHLTKDEQDLAYKLLWNESRLLKIKRKRIANALKGSKIAQAKSKAKKAAIKKGSQD